MNDPNRRTVLGLCPAATAGTLAGCSALDEVSRLSNDGSDGVIDDWQYDLSLEPDAAGYDITQVYGSPTAAEATGQLMRVNTLFLSQSDGGTAKGGVVLVQIERTEGAADAATLDLKTT